MPDGQCFLVLMPTPPSGLTLSIDAGLTVAVEPLFTSIKPAQSGTGGGANWHVVRTSLPADRANPWDVCHAIMQTQLGLPATAAPVFAEPDFPQEWIADFPDEETAPGQKTCDPQPQKTDGLEGYPGEPDNYWYLDDAHGEYTKALASIDIPTDRSAIVRVAHVDTGYDPGQKSLPVNLDTQNQRNFVDDEPSDNAADDSSGPLNNRGHGTGTLGILAGNPIAPSTLLGVAPFLNVVPIRVSDYVALFRTRAVAQAFDYVHQLCEKPETTVHVVTMSMGGWWPSQVWADAVNALYERGVVLVTAAGNNIGNAPTHHILYPARFNRVIAACGVMADHTPFADLALYKLAGNYGPPGKMRTAMAAYTPNVPWAKLGCPTTINYDGRGTSAATPQIAAAAALWIQKNKIAWEKYPEGWMRVEAVRHALFSSAVNSSPDKLGRGELRAASALNVAPPQAQSLDREEPDDASYSQLEVLAGHGFDKLSDGRRRMLELEALQLSQSAAIEKILGDRELDLRTLGADQQRAVAKALAEHPRASNALRKVLGY